MHRVLTGPLTVERVRVEIADLPNSLNNLRLVQLSDFHFDGLRLSERLLKRAIAASNAAAPDVVLLTGDYITDDPAYIHELAPWLKTLHSRCGIIACLGNHDICRRPSRAEVTQALSSVGVVVLWNDVAYPLGPELPIVGLADFWSAEFAPAPVMAKLNPAVPRIILSHNPDTAELLQAWRVDLQLSGHTHGGQVVVPGVGTLAQLAAPLYYKLPKRVRRSLPGLKSYYRVAKHWEWSQGLHRVGSNQLYVNRGLGTYFPGRVFCPPEVTVITLVSSPGNP
ncbi:metallophosphoesterase [Leptolyngbya sp. FACHB-36]|uniref:metallophosphoesterase n=1 Tax=Leptolyngbya sp. FACHB-36 TaxID=2692808 RepID=UPI00168000C9|nr:metallophosphoesterase [Leptolyngbya sp. FACHB-36]MBD2020093.1 metallophosphoesterase [Leptolyngbya sp. FACHB-36]